MISLCAGWCTSGQDDYQQCDRQQRRRCRQNCFSHLRLLIYCHTAVDVCPCHTIFVSYDDWWPRILCRCAACLEHFAIQRHCVWDTRHLQAGVYSLRHPMHFVTRVMNCIIVFRVYYSVYTCFGSKASRRYHNYVELLQHLKLYCCKSDT